MSQNTEFGYSYVGSTPELSEANKSSEDEQRKVPALRKVVMEVIEKQKIQKFIKPIWQLLEKKNYELAMEIISPIMKWNSGNLVHPSEIHPSESGNLKLQFLGNFSPQLFTGNPIAQEENSLQVALLDAVTGEVVTSGPEASAKVEIVVVDGDFGVDEGGDWTLEEFNSKIVSGMEGKKSLLGGKRYLRLKDGIGSVHKIYFRHTSVWMKCGEYRLGAKVVDHSSRFRIREAKTEPFIVKDRRGMNQKHYPPSLSDEVWRLENIQKGGCFHKRLSNENIGTVKDFLTQYDLNHERLQEILGKSMIGKRWEATVNHALTCKHYTSLAHRSLPSSDGLYPKNFNNPDCSNVCNFGTSDMHDHYKPTQPGTSFPDNDANIDLYNLGPLFSDGDIQNWLPFQNCDLEPGLKNLGLESVANQQSTVHALAVTSGKLRSRWVIISKGLIWLFKTRKLVSLKRNNVAKKRRLG